MRPSPIFVALYAGLLLSHPVAADELGNVQRGLAYAEETCAGCHGIRLDDFLSPVAEAQPFKMIADIPGMTRLALKAFLRSAHPSMPNLMVEGEEADNVIAYILSLKGQDAAGLR